MPLSVIIPNLNSPAVDRTIASLLAQSALDQIAEIVVVGLDRPGLVRSDRLVRLLDTGRPLAAAAARNRGAAATHGDMLLFVDADCELHPQAVEHLLAAMRPSIGAIVAAVAPETTHYWRLAANMMAFPDFLTTDRAGPRDCLPSFCLLVPRTVWDEVGAFDERFPGASCEDLDLTYRMRRAGYTLWCEPAAIVFHRPPRDSPGDVWRRHADFGPGWRHLVHRYTDLLPFSEAIWICERLPRLAPALLVPLTILFVLRLVARRPHMLRHWYAVPGMIWAQYGFYYGILHSVLWELTFDQVATT
jgi:glycosyltransferase involved in cell wall biosynthesis